jgi:nucleoside-diphosphate-sugar epimerase
MTPSHPYLRLAPRPGKVAVIGANSNLGRRMILALGSDAVPIARDPLPAAYSAQAVVVSDYAHIPAQAFDGCGAVVNCVGVASGTEEMMTRVNVDISAEVARAASNSGISRFVHISSFSVYGKAQHIDVSTSEAPLDAYGESKLKADHALSSSTALDVAILRLPAIIGQGVPSKLSQLVSIWRKLRILPVARDAQRSMITIDAAAAAACVLARADGPVGGKWLVADPYPVNLRRLARLTDTQGQSGLRALVLPDLVTAGLRRTLPGVFEKVYGSSILADEANAYLSLGLTARLDDEILRMIEE